MARRKRSLPLPPPATAVATAESTAPSVLAPPPPSASRMRWLLLGAALAVSAALAVWHLRTRAPGLPPVVSQDSGAVGGRSLCRQLPQWIAQRSPSSQASFSTSERGRPGLQLVDPSGQRYRHPSWSDAGWLGPILLDGMGNVWVAPVPVINLIENRPDEQNRLWVVGADETLRMQLELPASAPSSAENPYGLLGLAYDCDTASIYASSVMGSDRSHERGTIFQVDAGLAALRSRWDGVDAMGLVVFRGRTGKRLYYASARLPQVLSVALDTTGAVAGVPRPEFSLDGLGPRGDDRGRRLRIEPDGTLSVFGIEFSFNLVAPTEKQETRYQFRYDETQDKFVLIRIGDYEVN